MDAFWHKIKVVFQDPALRFRILFVVGALIAFRLGAAIPIPGVNQLALQRFFSGNQFFGLLNVFSGGGFSTLSIFMLGVGPFITASIILQLLTIMIPSLKELYQEAGEAGRRKFAQYSRLLAVPLAALQAFSFLIILQRQGVVANLSLSGQIINVITVVAGSLLLMWIGELISEYGIGNGVSLIIFAGILSRLPQTIGQLAINYTPSQIPTYILFAVAAIVIIAGVVIVTEGERPIPVTYAKRVRGTKVYGGSSTYLPIRLNQAGVMPIIFALSILLFPQMIANFLSHVANTTVSSLAAGVLRILSNSTFYAIAYFFLVFVFTYFYSAITFDPEAISENLQKNGAFVPGIRPGRPTAEYIAKVLYRLTFVGALFLGIVAVIPLIVQAWSGISALAIGGTALLIVVSVALDFMKQVDSQLSLREY
jgi:preprotein translocase subunit SecY